MDCVEAHILILNAALSLKNYHANLLDLISQKLWCSPPQQGILDSVSHGECFGLVCSGILFPFWCKCFQSVVGPSLHFARESYLSFCREVIIIIYPRTTYLTPLILKNCPAMFQNYCNNLENMPLSESWLLFWHLMGLSCIILNFFSIENVTTNYVTLLNILTIQLGLLGKQNSMRWSLEFIICQSSDCKKASSFKLKQMG